LKRGLITALALLAGCAGKPEAVISDAQLTQLTPGRTRMAEVETLWGAPSERRAGMSGPQLVYGWDIGRANDSTVAAGAGIAAGTIETQRSEIVLTFDGDTTLTDIERFTRTTRQGYMSGPPLQQ